MDKIHKNKRDYLAFIIINPEIKRILSESCANNRGFTRKQKPNTIFLRKLVQKTGDRNN